MSSLLSVAPSTIVARLAAGDLKDATPAEIRALLFDGAALTPATVASADKVLIQDADDSDTLKTVTAQSIADLNVSAGDVVGPGSSTDNALARFDLATGKLIQNSVVLVDDAGAMTGMTTVDGRDLSVDGAKLDLIEALADVTDETNVVASLDGATLTGVTVATGDKVLIQDITDSDNLKTVTAQSIADLAPSVNQNLLINSNFDIWQREGPYTAVADDEYTADRWVYGTAGAGVITITQDTDVPDKLSESSLKIDVTTADASLAAGDRYHISQKIEGFNTIGMGLGAAGAASITVSFWVKSPKTGIHSVYFQNSAANRSYIAEYTIAVADTWEFFEVTIVGDVAGTWLQDNGIGLEVGFGLAAGTTFDTAPDVWTAGDFVVSTNQVNVMDNAANNFLLAQVKVEIAGAASGFVPPIYQTDFLNAQRYARVLSGFLGKAANTVLCQFAASHPGMRDDPSYTATDVIEITDVTAANFTQSTAQVSLIEGDQNGGRISCSNFTGLTSADEYIMVAGVNGRILVTAEL